MKTILTSVDFSDASSPVIDASIELATSMGADILLLHVITPPVVASEYGLVMESVSEITSAATDACAKKLEQLRAQITSAGVTVQSQQTLGTPVDSILSIAAEEEVSYIVMGSHGHSALYDLLVGSTTHGVLTQAPCPVFIVPPDKSKK